MTSLHLSGVTVSSPPDADARSEDLSSGMPWWVRAVAIIGIPGMLAIYLVYIGAQELPSIRRAAEQSEKEVLRNREVISSLATQVEALGRQVQRICYNTAKTDAERDRCFD